MRGFRPRSSTWRPRATWGAASRAASPSCASPSASMTGRTTTACWPLPGAERTAWETSSSGARSLERFLSAAPADTRQADYPELARASAGEIVGSSAGGERPKFGAWSGGRHVLVKFQSPESEGAARRWRDLLWCEWKALETVAAAGRPAARSTLLDVQGWRFLEVERFDRAGPRGRRAILSLAALCNEYLGGPGTWTDAAPGLCLPPLRLPRGDADALRWLDVFGQLIGNSDRHLGTRAASNSTTARSAWHRSTTCSHDPGAERDVITPRRPLPDSANANTLDVWPDAARWAVRYWREVETNQALDTRVREHAARARVSIEELMRLAAVPVD